MYRAVVVSKSDDGTVSAELRTDLDDAGHLDLADADADADAVAIAVEWSGINYKDGLALAGAAGVMRTNPLVPGIDIVGTVVESRSDRWSPGDSVIVNGWGVGETHDGGLAERARVRGDWIIRRPATISSRRAAAIGTAGFTAALAVRAIERAGSPSGDILVTGASGGVGSIAIALLAAAGHRVIAATGHPEQRDYLLGLGATDTIDRAELDDAGRPLQKQRWAAAIDSVGGQTLATVLAQTAYGGTVVACGLVGGTDIPTTVMPFILRGVTLVGINSVECPLAERVAAWQRLAADLDLDLLDSLTTEVPLEGAIEAGERILRGDHRGRTVVNLQPRSPAR